MNIIMNIFREKSRAWRWINARRSCTPLAPRQRINFYETRDEVNAYREIFNVTVSIVLYRVFNPVHFRPPPQARCTVFRWIFTRSVIRTRIGGYRFYIYFLALYRPCSRSPRLIRVPTNTQQPLLLPLTFAVRNHRCFRALKESESIGYNYHLAVMHVGSIGIRPYCSEVGRAVSPLVVQFS